MEGVPAKVRGSGGPPRTPSANAGHSNPPSRNPRFGTKDFCDAQCDFLHKTHFHCVVEECGALFSTLDGAVKHAK